MSRFTTLESVYREQAGTTEVIDPVYFYGHLWREYPADHPVRHLLLEHAPDDDKVNLINGYGITVDEVATLTQNYKVTVDDADAFWAAPQVLRTVSDVEKVMSVKDIDPAARRFLIADAMLNIDLHGQGFTDWFLEFFGDQEPGDALSDFVSAVAPYMIYLDSRFTRAQIRLILNRVGPIAGFQFLATLGEDSIGDAALAEILNGVDDLWGPDWHVNMYAANVASLILSQRPGVLRRLDRKEASPFLFLAATGTQWASYETWSKLPYVHLQSGTITGDMDDAAVLLVFLTTIPAGNENLYRNIVKTVEPHKNIPLFEAIYKEAHRAHGRPDKWPDDGELDESFSNSRLRRLNEVIGRALDETMLGRNFDAYNGAFTMRMPEMWRPSEFGHAAELEAHRGFVLPNRCTSERILDSFSYTVPKQSDMGRKILRNMQTVRHRGIDGRLVEVGIDGDLPDQHDPVAEFAMHRLRGNPFELDAWRAAFRIAEESGNPLSGEIILTAEAAVS